MPDGIRYPEGIRVSAGNGSTEKAGRPNPAHERTHAPGPTGKRTMFCGGCSGPAAYRRFPVGRRRNRTPTPSMSIGRRLRHEHFAPFMALNRFCRFLQAFRQPLFARVGKCRHDIPVDPDFIHIFPERLRNGRHVYYGYHVSILSGRATSSMTAAFPTHRTPYAPGAPHAGRSRPGRSGVGATLPVWRQCQDSPPARCQSWRPGPRCRRPPRPWHGSRR